MKFQKEEPASPTPLFREMVSWPEQICYLTIKRAKKYLHALFLRQKCKSGTHPACLCREVATADEGPQACSNRAWKWNPIVKTDIAPFSSVEQLREKRKECVCVCVCAHGVCAYNVCVPYVCVCVYGAYVCVICAVFLCVCWIHKGVCMWGWCIVVVYGGCIYGLCGLGVWCLCAWCVVLWYVLYLCVCVLYVQCVYMYIWCLCVVRMLYVHVGGCGLYAVCMYNVCGMCVCWGE